MFSSSKLGPGSMVENRRILKKGSGKKNGELSYWGEGRRRSAARSPETSTINYTNLQMAFNVN